MGYAGLPIALVPHPFGALPRSELKNIAADVARQVAELISSVAPAANDPHPVVEVDRALALEVDGGLEAVNRLLRERRWSDGLPVMPPTPDRVARMLAQVTRSRYELIARIPPAFGAATVERIAINAVLAGCDPGCMEVLIAAVEAVAAPQFNIQGIQATSNPAAVWMIVSRHLSFSFNTPERPGEEGSPKYS